MMFAFDQLTHKNDHSSTEDKPTLNLTNQRIKLRLSTSTALTVDLSLHKNCFCCFSMAAKAFKTSVLCTIVPIG